MENQLFVQNSLTGKKEKFEPIEEGRIGLYVCGPTVYSDVHLGNCRTFTSFDVIYRYLVFLGYKVRYVRNITDVGHLLDDGEDRMSKGARAQQLEPMEVAQKYSNGFHDMMRVFNNLSPDIEPRATGHIIEQIEMVQAIMDDGLGYEANGSVYFDTTAFRNRYNDPKGEIGYTYGMLSGRNVDDLLNETRDLKNQGEKRAASDFAIWMKASDDHLMKWNSPWSLGFPGWHLECSAMSTKYLGKRFDIHGGGNDLKFPHHENEIAQNVGACGCMPANYWLHTNMLLMNGRKMSKSDGNTISPDELFTGDSPHVTKGYSPMSVRFFMLQSHYSSPLDLTDAGLQGAEKGYKRLMNGLKTLETLETNASDGEMDEEVIGLIQKVYEEMNQDFNTPKALAVIFDLISKINAWSDGHVAMTSIGASALQQLKKELPLFIEQVLGLKNELDQGSASLENELMDVIIGLRKTARENKDWATSDQIRDQLAAINVLIKDGKEGTTWSKK